MKRTPMKRKTPMKRGKKAMPRKRKTPWAKAKADAWAAFSLYIVTRDGQKTTGNWEYCNCVTCGKQKPTRGKGRIQAGHFLGGRTGRNLFDERGVHGQCMGCNCMGNGQPIKYMVYMQKEYGQEVIDELIYQAGQPYKYSIAEFWEIEKNCKVRTAIMEGKLV